jgi:hypothetical protein
LAGEYQLEFDFCFIVVCVMLCLWYVLSFNKISC